MTSPLKQSTAIEIKVGPFVDATDGFTAETGLTILQADVRLAKNAADWGQKHESTTLVHEENGWYRCLLDTTDTDTLGILMLAINAAGARPVFIALKVMAANVYDSIVGGGDLLDVNTAQVGGTAQTAGDIIASISGIGTAGGAAINTDAATDNEAGGITGVTSGTTKLGTQTGTFANTSALDGVLHEITGTATALDHVYQFLTGAGTAPVAVIWTGYVNSANDIVTIQAWNHVGAAWETLTTIQGIAGTVNTVKNIVLYSRHVGTSVAELGKAYIRFVAVGMTNPSLHTDQLYVSYAVISRTVGYANGAVWLDTTAGFAGTVPFVNGTADHPSDTWANALAIAVAVGLRHIHIANGSSIQLIATLSNYLLMGDMWTLDLNGQDVSDSVFMGALVSGVCTGSGRPEFQNCDMRDVTLPPGDLHYCSFETTITLGSAGDYLFDQCYSKVAGDTIANSPVIDFGAVGASNLSVRHYAGGIELKNMTALDRATVAGTGAVVLNANCTGGVVAIRGSFELDDNSGGAVTLVDDARYDLGQVRAAVGLASANIDTRLGDLPTNAELATALGTADDAVLAAVAALNNLSAAQAQTAAAAALAAYDGPTHTELTNELATADDATLAAIAALNDLSEANVRTAVGLATANMDTQFADAIAAVADVWTTAIIESYALMGAEPTPAQVMMMILQALTESNITGTDWVVRRLDGATPAFALTLNSAVTPTDVARSG